MEWLDDEELQATLVMVGDWSAEQHPSDSAPARPRTVNRSRERRKRETIELRVQLRELQDELRSQHQRRTALLRRGTRQAPLWEGIARRQAAARIKAEAENSELRRAVSRQLRFTRELKRVAERARHDGSHTSPSTAPTTPGCSDFSWCMSEDDQMRRVEEISTQWPDQFNTNQRFAGAATEFYEAKVVRCNEAEIVHEARALLPLPFSVADVGEAVWAICKLEQSSDADDSYAQTHRVLKDWIIAQFTTMLRAGGMHGEIKGRFVAKRMQRGSDHAVVACSYSDPEGLHPQLDGVRIFEDSWTRLVDAPNLDNSEFTSSHTLVHFVRQTQIRFPVSDEDVVTSGRPSQMDQVASFLDMHIREELESMRQALESALVLTHAAV